MSQGINELRKTQATVSDITAIVVLLLLTGVFAFSHNFKSAPVIIKTGEVGTIVLEPIPRTTFEKPKPIVDRVFIPVDYNSESGEVLGDIEGMFPGFDEPVISEDPMPIAPIFVVDDIIDFTAIAEVPEIIGGVQALSANLVYPPMAKKAQINGKAIIQFVVDIKGFTTDLRILQEKPADMGFGESAMKAIAATRFSPGMQGDKPVKVRMVLPVNFQIK